MRYFCKIQLKKAKLNEIVYAACPKDAETIAKANVSNLVEQWDTCIENVTAISFFDLGIYACRCRPDITYVNGHYYFAGRKVSEDINFINGFEHQYKINQSL